MSTLSSAVIAVANHLNSEETDPILNQILTLLINSKPKIIVEVPEIEDCEILNTNQTFTVVDDFPKDSDAEKLFAMIGADKADYQMGPQVWEKCPDPNSKNPDFMGDEPNPKPVVDVSKDAEVEFVENADEQEIMFERQKKFKEELETMENEPDIPIDEQEAVLEDMFKRRKEFEQQLEIQSKKQLEPPAEESEILTEITHNEIGDFTDAELAIIDLPLTPRAQLAVAMRKAASEDAAKTDIYSGNDFGESAPIGNNLGVLTVEFNNMKISDRKKFSVKVFEAIDSRFSEHPVKTRMEIASKTLEFLRSTPNVLKRPVDDTTEDVAISLIDATAEDFAPIIEKISKEIFDADESTAG